MKNYVISKENKTMREFQVPTGMPLSIWQNKYARRKSDGTYQTWAERLEEVVDGNFSLDTENTTEEDYIRTMELAKAGVFATSGRHLQHGDLAQKTRLGERYSNCSSSMTSFMKFWLLMKGSGVGRDYSSDICRVNWDNMPNARFVIEGPDPVTNMGGHPDYEPWMETVQEARHKYDSESEAVRWFKVADSAEGWTKVVEILETAAFQERHKDKLFVFDFTGVRAKGTAIKGQQGRPASGPGPLMRALIQVSRLKGSGMKPWKQALFVDHYLSSCVALGGIRRAARLAGKYWKDRDVIDFIDIKRGGWLWSANNSVIVDDEFWEQAQSREPSHARRVFEAMVAAAYFDKTGEPGFINAHNFNWHDDGMDNITAKTLFGARAQKLLKMHDNTLELYEQLLKVMKRRKYCFIPNPCGEVLLSIAGAYCIIGDLCMANAKNKDELRDAARLMAQFLIRVNMLDYAYEAEVKRTNRIGVALTGIFEFAWSQYGYTFHDLIDKDKSADFWEFMNELADIVDAEAERYAKLNGMAVPHTTRTMKPSGTISKVMACTEAAHLPPYAFFLRWVQFLKGSPEHHEHEARGYPVKDVSHQYTGHVVVGFPTSTQIGEMMGDKVVTAGDVTPFEQYRWVQLLEGSWLGGTKGMQVSYTLKYNQDEVSYEQYMRNILENQPYVRAISTMPQIDTSAYAYQPEEACERSRYDDILSNIDRIEAEAYDKASLECEGGACPIEIDLNHEFQQVN